MPAASAAPAGPVELQERIVFIDALRGLALFGILTANMRGFFAPLMIYDRIQLLYPGRADMAAQALIDIFVQGKCVSIFAFLFGLGFAMQMMRAEARGARFMAFYPRRLAVLALFGILHGALIWGGDILLTYALAGAILLPFRRRRQAILLRWAFGLICLPPVLSTMFFVIYHTRFRQAWMVPKPVDMVRLHHIIGVYAHGNAGQIAWQNLLSYKAELPATLFGLYAAALFILGMWVWRRGVVQTLPAFRPVFRRVLIWGLAVGLPLNVFTAFARLQPGQITAIRWLGGMLFLPAAHLLAAAYMSGLALIFLAPRGRTLLLPFAAIGRMALTNYLLQSVICTAFFYRYGTGSFGGVGPARGLLLGSALFALQVAASNLWLRTFRFGPVEWLWRGLTYGRFPALRAHAAACVSA